MSSQTVAHGDSRPGVIQLRLRTLDQLFNMLDPAPFHEKDLDHDAEEFIVSWAEELQGAAALELVVYLAMIPEQPHPEETLRQAMANYFTYRAEMARLELRRLLGRGRLSLAIALVVLVVAMVTADLISRLGDRTLYRILGEGLVIGGWVAMWRPMEVFLYSWWPIARRIRLLRRLAAMKVTLRPA
jgi:hypothetical protein